MKEFANPKYNPRMIENVLALILLGRMALRPQPKLKISEWVKKRYISKEESARPGLYDNSLVPFADVIMDDFIDPEVETIAVMGPAQFIKTEIIKNVIGYFIDYMPCPMMYVSPTETTSAKFSRTKLQPMIENNSFLREKIKKGKNRKTDSIFDKQFSNGASLNMLGSNSANSFGQFSVKIALLDDKDRMPANVGGEGDPGVLAFQRTESYALLGRKKGDFSTPTIEGSSPIEKDYKQSDQRYIELPCPHCGHYQELKFENLKWEKETNLMGKVTKHLPDTVKLQCINEDCGKPIEEKYKYEMLQKYRIVAEHPEIKSHRGYRFSRLYSQMSSWKGIVKEFLNAKDDTNKLQGFFNTVLGKTFKIVDYKSIEEEELLTRCEKYMTPEQPYMPNGVLVLTAFVDVQGYGLDCEVKGWGKGFENWSIAREVFEGSINQDDCWIEMFKYIRETIFTRQDGLTKKVAVCFVDSGDEATRVYEMLEGSYPLFIPTKGRFGNKPLIPQTYSKVYNNRIILLMLGVDNGKLQVMEDLKIAKPGPRYCHFSEGHNNYEYFRGLTAERVVPKYSARGSWVVFEKKSKNRRNEPFDQAVGNLAAIVYLNPDYEVIETNDKKELEKMKEVKTEKPIKPAQQIHPGFSNNNYLNAGVNQHVKW